MFMFLYIYTYLVARVPLRQLNVVCLVGLFGCYAGLISVPSTSHPFGGLLGSLPARTTCSLTYALSLPIQINSPDRKCCSSCSANVCRCHNRESALRTHDTLSDQNIVTLLKSFWIHYSSPPRFLLDF